ncbi:carbonic anhydrase-related protein A isoform X3 [Andrena cerasifolii]|uniref:carbonic anhydrase-related protein A isoform X3 n=1 Tax=Andrena cerasifolii TaxID=2819439 RepID=UPI0040377CA0
MCLSRRLLLCLLGVIVAVNDSEASWDEWWTYDGISGPSFWGLINPQWSLCSKGRRQSPINIEPNKLLFDRHLRPVLVDKHKVSGNLHNTGQFLVFRADREAKVRVNITGGPLAYHYQFEEIYIHYGLDNDHGSEHRINNYAFPAELGEKLNSELQIITSVFNKVIHRGDEAPVRHLSLKSLLPETNGYMTYEGSTTHPGCWETAVWLILNKPIYVTARELYALRKLMQGPVATPKAPLGNNSRPLQDLHYRTIRTNIDFRKRPDSKCPSMAQDMHYRDDFFFPANTWQDDGSLSHNMDSYNIV